MRNVLEEALVFRYHTNHGKDVAKFSDHKEGCNSAVNKLIIENIEETNHWTKNTRNCSEVEHMDICCLLIW
jgi:hypothetical protein